MTSLRSAATRLSVIQRFFCQIRKPLNNSSLFLQHLRVSQPKYKHIFTSVPKLQNDSIKITFILADGERQDVKAKIGDNLLDIIIDNDVDIDGFGACEGTLACSTCHLIFHEEDYEKIPDKPTDEELDMLDLAYGLTDTSRLGCQVVVTKNMDGMEVIVPASVSDARSGSL